MLGALASKSSEIVFFNLVYVVSSLRIRFQWSKQPQADAAPIITSNIKQASKIHFFSENTVGHSTQETSPTIPTTALTNNPI